MKSGKDVESKRNVMMLNDLIKIDSELRRDSGIPTKAPLKSEVLRDGNER